MLPVLLLVLLQFPSFLKLSPKKNLLLLNALVLAPPREHRFREAKMNPNEREVARVQVGILK
jgi:hypothetical protein